MSIHLMESTCSTCKYKIVVFQLFDYLSLILRLPSGVLFLLKVLLLLLISTVLTGGRPVLPHSDIGIDYQGGPGNVRMKRINKYLLL